MKTPQDDKPDVVVNQTTPPVAPADQGTPTEDRNQITKTGSPTGEQTVVTTTTNQPSKLPWILGGLLALALLVLAIILLNSNNNSQQASAQIAQANAAVATMQAQPPSVVTNTEKIVIVQTAEPVIIRETAVPIRETTVVTAVEIVTNTVLVTPTAAPTAMEPANLGSTIMVSGTDVGVSLNNEFGDRTATTNGRVLFNHDAPFDKKTELPTVEQTWVTYTIATVKGDQVIVFAGGVKFKGTTYDGGALFFVGGDGQTIDIALRNGEIVVWHSYSDMVKDLSKRVSEQIAAGNLDIDGPLAFKWASPEVAGQDGVRELVADRKVTVVNLAVQ